MLIFALEASYMVRIAQTNLEEKKSLGKVTGTTRLYSAYAMLPLLGLIAVAGGALSLNRYSWVWIALFLTSAGGKLMWRKRISRAGSTS